MCDGIVWSDEIPSDLSDDVDMIRFLLRHRTCQIMVQDSEFIEWWERGKQLFPQWIGFMHTRCTPSNQLQEIYLQGKRQWKKYLN